MSSIIIHQFKKQEIGTKKAGIMSKQGPRYVGNVAITRVRVKVV